MAWVRGNRRLAHPIWRVQARIQGKVDVHGFASQRLGGILIDDTAIGINANVAVKGGGGGGHEDQLQMLMLAAQEWSWSWSCE
jgi:hypothetical protein